ncbi:MAG: MMPL family transporter [Clostridiales bacterium]
MLKLVNFYDKHKILLYILFAILVGISGFCITQVTVNYDMTKYLPEDSITKQSINILEKDFTYPGTARVAADNVTMLEAQQIKNKIAAVDGVASVMWLDNFANTATPTQFIDEKLLKDYYMDNKALYTIEFKEGDYSSKTGQAILEIGAIIGADGGIIGSAEDARFTRSILSEEATKIMLIVVPFCLLILMLAGKTWIEPLFYIASIGVAVAFNMGTNLIFRDISYITQSMASVLQLAISMDYSLFLFHRYLEEKDSGLERHQALAVAIKKSLSSISASALTTIAGFAALVFMQYRIGFDLGMVLGKGIVFSFLCTITFLPLLILSFHKVIDKTRHRSFLPTFAKHKTLRWKYPVIIIIILVAVPCFFAQNNNDFLYGDTSGSAGSAQMLATKEKVTKTFGESEPVMILVPNNNIAAEAKLCKDLQNLNFVRSVQSIPTLADPTIPRDMLPTTLKDQFLSEDFSRIVVFLNLGNESKLTYSTTEKLQNLADKYYDNGWYMAGKSTATTDIKQTIENDNTIISLFSILSVGLIILIFFQSVSLPVLLISVIEFSIWINMSVPYFQGTQLIYIGYLVVSSIQLGATIDYAILMSHRYMEFREMLPPNESAIRTMQTAGGSVITSALILTVAGMTEGIVSNIESVSQIGFLLGRGAFLSGLLVLVVLPRLLVVCDKLIMKTTYHGKRKKFILSPKTKEESL